MWVASSYGPQMFQLEPDSVHLALLLWVRNLKPSMPMIECEIIELEGTRCIIYSLSF